MSLSKSILHRKEKRKTYREKGRRAAEYVRSCRNHGGCEWCKRNRMINTLRHEEDLRLGLLEAFYTFPSNYYDERSDLDNYEQEVYNSLDINEHKTKR